MNGGSLSRVTRPPLSAPATIATPSPSIRASGPDSPCSLPYDAITIIAKIAAAPTDRSMPAVRMMSVCPTASAATTAVCWIISDTVPGSENRGLSTVNTTHVMARMIAGLTAGWACSTCWTRWSGCRRRSASSEAAPPAGAVVCGPPAVAALRSPALMSAPADLGGGRRVDALDAVGRGVGHELHAGVVEVQSLGGLRLLSTVGDRRDRLDALLGHDEGVLLGGRVDHAVGDRANALAAAVDRDDEHVIGGQPGGLQRSGGAVGGRLVDGVDDVDAVGAAQAGLHRRTTAVLGAVGGLVAHDLVVAAGVAAGRRLVAVLLRVGGVDAHAGEEALVAVVVDGDDLVVEQVEQRDGGLLAAELGGGPLTDELAGLEVVRR